jgi:hypothetical protein
MHVQDIYPQLVSKIKNMSDDSRLEIVRLILQNHLLKSDSELFQNILTVHNLQP